MWIVLLALRRPYTFTVMALMILLLGCLSYMKMAKDIFPSIDIPVVSVIWTYTGLPAQEMERRVTTVSERAMTTTVNDIEHIESQSLDGVSIIRVFFQPNAKIEAAVAQVTAINQTIVKVLPPGMTPPLILRYSASDVPIVQLSVGSKTLPEQDLYDLASNFIRVQLATVQGASIPLPYGGKPRQIMVDLDLQALQAKGLAPLDVVNAVNAQSVILPSGTAKIDRTEYKVLSNSSPSVIDELNNFPIKQVNGAMVYIRDVAHVRDGFAVQINVVRVNEAKAALLTILKNGGASTLDIIQRVKNQLPKIAATLPTDLKVTPLFDQSLFVSAALEGVEREALIAAGLTAAMILLFLGSWRSTLIVATSIPLSICCSLIALAALGQTINIMTLGGLSLAVGILVDDTTVAIENIHRNRTMGKSLMQAILDGSQQIAMPAFVSTLCICIVFVPIFFLGGVARYLFVPLAMAVVFAMMASYFLSRTVVPTMARYLLGGEAHPHGDLSRMGLFEKVHHYFMAGFERLRLAYLKALGWSLKHPVAVTLAAVFCVAGSLAALTPVLGRDFFPLVDAGQFRLHVRGPVGLRLEETQLLFTRVHKVIEAVIPKDELSLMLDDIGLPVGGTNLAMSDAATIGPADGEILVSLNKTKHGPTWDYVRVLRKRLAREFPDCVFFTQPSDIVGQIMNFGLPAPIDVQVVGRDPSNVDIARQLAREIGRIPGAADVHLHQVAAAPTLFLEMDRTRAEQLGLSQRDVMSDVLVSLSSSGQTAPNYWVNPKNGVNYAIGVQTPQGKMDSVDALAQTPIAAPNLKEPQLLGNLASVTRTTSPAVVNHYNVQPVYDVYANVQKRDLGSVSDAVAKIIQDKTPKLPRGTTIMVRGQAKSMNDSFFALGFGVLAAILLVYFLLVVNFQSWLDPFIIVMALPGAITGILWALFLTQTPLSVPALMGALMSIGVATANSILMITFANDRRLEGCDAMQAALDAGATRLRPVFMTALAMILGMLPMSLGLGEGGEQNAPLGRAVIGGLIVATLFTLIFVPVVYSKLRRKPAKLETDPLLREPVPAN
ncbi:MAG: efflux RND transporter permease subunit [Chthoniobacteraceae bacterium]|nr:efflux RND transporter permease subunit [Chthoniobacteraceae bacterium]